MQKCIQTKQDFLHWQSGNCPAYNALMSFILKINDSIQGKSIQCNEQVTRLTNPTVQSISSILSTLQRSIKEIELEKENNSRFGNLAYRNWQKEKLQPLAKEMTESISVRNCQLIFHWPVNYRVI